MSLFAAPQPEPPKEGNPMKIIDYLCRLTARFDRAVARFQAWFDRVNDRVAR